MIKLIKKIKKKPLQERSLPHLFCKIGDLQQFKPTAEQ